MSVKTTLDRYFNTESLKSYVAVNYEDRTQSKPSVRTVKMSSTLSFAFLKKASSITFIRRWLELTQILCLMLQEISTKHGIYT